MTQTQFPTADVSTTGWTTAPLWDDVDDDSDTDSIDAGVRSADATCELHGGNLSDPASSSDHIITVRAKYTTNNSRVGAIKVQLYEGTTLRATLGSSWQTLTTSWAAYTYTLSAGEADSMTYSDIHFKVTGHMNSGGLGTQCNVQVSSVKFTCPDGGSPPSTVIPVLMQQVFRRL